MDKMQEKASKLFNDFRKVKNTLRERDGHSARHGENAKKDAFTFSTCYYCPKVFKSANFLLKHMQRRHAEELILLHQKITSSTSGVDVNSNMMKDLFNFLEGEFGYLKKELKSIEQTVTSSAQVCSAVGQDATFNNERHFSDKTPSHYSALINEKTTSSEELFDCNEFKELKLQQHETEYKVRNLTEKFEELFKVIKEDVVLKHDVQKKTAFDESLILKQQEEFLRLKNTLLSELQAMIFSQLQENNLHHKELLSNFKQELERHESLIQLNSVKIDSPDYLKEMKEEFEKQLLYFIENTEAFKHRRKKSRSTHTIHSSVNSRKSAHKNKIFIHHSNNKRVSGIADITSNLISQKMLNFNIPPDIKKISSVEYEKKMDLINSEKALLSRRHKNFLQTYNNIDSCANQQALLQLSERKSKKLRFSDSHNFKLHISENHVKNCQNKLNENIKPELVGPDLGGCGDSTLQVNTDFSGSKSESFDVDNNETFVVQSGNEPFRHEYEYKTSEDFHVTSFPASMTGLNYNITSEFDDKSSLESLSSWEDKDIESRSVDS